MKIRTDYVSNSSSSSFVLGNIELFEFFDITKKDIMDALIELYGGKEAYKKAEKECKKSCKKYPDYHKEELASGNCGPFWVYDLFDKKDREAAIKTWGNLLKGWETTNCHFVTRNTKHRGQVALGGDLQKAYDTIIRGLYDVYGVTEWDLKEAAEDPTVELKKFIRDEKKDPKTGMYGHYEPLDQCVLDAVKAIRSECGIMTNLDAIKCKMARFFIHADDNELMRGSACEPGKDDEHYKKNERKDWDTEHYSYDRICEIILKHLVEKGKVKLDDPEFLKEMEVDEKYLSAWDKEHGCKYNFTNGKNFTWQDLKWTSLTWNMHEG